MTCPKCNESMLIKIRFSKSTHSAHLCEYCETVWFNKKNAAKHNGTPFYTVLNENGPAHTVGLKSGKGYKHTFANF